MLFCFLGGFYEKDCFLSNIINKKFPILTYIAQFLHFSCFLLSQNQNTSQKEKYPLGCIQFTLCNQSTNQILVVVQVLQSGYLARRRETDGVIFINVDSGCVISDSKSSEQTALVLPPLPLVWWPRLFSILIILNLIFL